MKIPFSRTIKTAYKSYLLQKSDWKFSKQRANMYCTEYPQWTKYYLTTTETPTPTLGYTSLITYKTILDIGAGEGETAKFFLEKGATKVICIEPDTEAYQKLYKNSQTHPNIIAIQDIFRLQQIQEAYPTIDLIKIDIEGYEEELLQLPNPKTPIVLEIHGLQLAEKFKAKGYYVTRLSTVGDLSFGYWKCKPQ